MPVFNFDFNRSVSSLDMNAARSGIFTPGLSSLELHDDELQRFNDIVRRVAPGKPAFHADQIAGAARRVLRVAMKGEESTFIKARMRRAGEMRAALKDKQWEPAPKFEMSMRAIVDYLDDPIGLIADDVPVVGLLDDAILVDVAMDTMRGELDDYADFCRFRIGEAARLDVALDAVTIERDRWYCERQQELRLEQQLRRVRGSTYGKSDMQAGFRIC